MEKHLNWNAVGLYRPYPCLGKKQVVKEKGQFKKAIYPTSNRIFKNDLKTDQRPKWKGHKL